MHLSWGLDALRAYALNVGGLMPCELMLKPVGGVRAYKPQTLSLQTSEPQSQLVN